VSAIVVDWTVVSVPVLPDYSGANVRGVVPALLAPPGVPLPAWFAGRSDLREAHQIVVLVLDGLGWLQLVERSSLAPTLTALAGGSITTVAPSTTATALTSITTGLTPGEHGIIGYRMDLSGEVLNSLRWGTAAGDARRRFPPAEMQPFAPFLGHDVPVVSRAELEGTGFSSAHLAGTRHFGWRTPSSLVVEISALVHAGEPFVYAYYDGVDKIAHERGFGDHYDNELRYVDRLVGDVLSSLPRGCALVVTADHGQVEVGDRLITLDDSVMRLVHHQSGEGRFRWLHARAGAAPDLAATLAELHGQVAWVVGRDEVIEQGWFGSVVPPPVAARMGDVALVARDDVAFHDPDDSGPFRLVCRHGSLTAEEMYVPLLVGGDW
jgi:hypothetical protein